MNKKQFIILVVFTIIFAFIGGALSVQIFFSKSLFGQVQQVGRFNVVETRELRIVDEPFKKILALLKVTYESDPSVICVFNDWNGIPRIQLMVDGYGNPSAHFWNKEAKNVIFQIVKYPSISFWKDSDQLVARVPTIE